MQDSAGTTRPAAERLVAADVLTVFDDALAAARRANWRGRRRQRGCSYHRAALLIILHPVIYLLATTVACFYGEHLGFAVVVEWDRPRSRGRRFDLGGLRLEVLDNAREPHPLARHEPGDRVHVVVEVKDIDAIHRGLSIEAPEPKSVS